MDPVGLAREFAQACVDGTTTRDDLFEWLCNHDRLLDVAWKDLQALGDEIGHALSFRIVVTID